MIVALTPETYLYQSLLHCKNLQADLDSLIKENQILTSIMAEYEKAVSNHLYDTESKLGDSIIDESLHSS